MAKRTAKKSNNFDFAFFTHLCDFYIVIERDEDGLYAGEVPQLKACYSQGETIDKLMADIQEALELCLAEEKHCIP